MRIMIINPNTSISMTDHIREELMPLKRSDTELTVTCPDKGPETIESAYDEAFATPPTLGLVKKANLEGYDAVVLACFSDPGLHAAREISRYRRIEPSCGSHAGGKIFNYDAQKNPHRCKTGRSTHSGHGLFPGIGSQTGPVCGGNRFRP